MKDRKATKTDAPGPPAHEGGAGRASDDAQGAAESTVVEAVESGKRAAETLERVRRDEASETGEQAEDLPPLDEVDVLRAERDVLQDKLLRLAAEYDNFRKRNAREWQVQRKRAAADVMREMLEICDNLERALETASDDASGLRKGVELIHQQFQALFARFGLETFEAEGQAFDPHRHEAVQMVESDEVKSEHVVNVVQRGYLLHGEILRPARVTVSK